VRSLTLATDLRRAIEQETLEVCTSPLFKLLTGDVIGCEACCAGPTRSTGLSHRWSSSLWRKAPASSTRSRGGAGQALAQLRAWRELIPGLTVAVNLSARSLANGRCLHRVDAPYARKR